MDFETREDQQGLRDAVRRVLAAECPLAVALGFGELGLDGVRVGEERVLGGDLLEL